jgi:hypothetical protein
MNTCSGPVIWWLAEAVRRDSRPETTQPSPVGPGGLAQASPQVGGDPPIGASYV